MLLLTQIYLSCNSLLRSYGDKNHQRQHFLIKSLILIQFWRLTENLSSACLFDRLYVGQLSAHQHMPWSIRLAGFSVYVSVLLPAHSLAHMLPPPRPPTKPSSRPINGFRQWADRLINQSITFFAEKLS